ncbi:response regulator [Gynurincola endophyticus]|uniref:response regulator n=1 Tax=Gynurincola endophyticus TaxID=2479004 RepID=UPI000F8D1B96|nr:response regulator [Gynurincola endophyticus]
MKSFRRNLIISYSTSIVLLLIASIASYISIQTLLTSTDRVNHTMTVLSKLDNILSLAKDAETGQRGYLLTGNQTFLKPFDQALEEISVETTALKSLVADNPIQVFRADTLKGLVTERVRFLKNNIELYGTKNDELHHQLLLGKEMMDNIRTYIGIMKQDELQLLNRRDARLKAFATYTPIIIVLASLISILITVVSFRRTMLEFESRSKMQRALEEKDADITHRINVIRDIANKISEGDYSTRAQDQGEDGLGNVSIAINRMAKSLENSFNALSDREWLQTGVTHLNDAMLGEYEMEVLSRKVIDYVVEYTDSVLGNFYQLDENRQLVYCAGYGVEDVATKMLLTQKSGLLYEAIRKNQVIHLKDIPRENVVIPVGSGNLVPAHLLVIPFQHERRVEGVLLIGSVKPFSEKAMAFFNDIRSNIGTTVNGIKNRKKLQELFEETQSQAEELQAQHNELENINSELEAQTEKLQASEEELRVQQEELIEVNETLEQRAKMLEEKNQLVFERNLEIQRKAEELEQSTRYKSEFLANMSHELRTPLNSILLLSRLLVENTVKNLTLEQVEYAQVIHGSGQGLLALIDEILDLSKIEAGKMDLVYQSVPVQEILEDMRSLFDPIAKEKDLNFYLELDASLPALLDTDKMRLEQILKNLISNALKFTAEGYVKLEAKVSEGKNDHISFAVTDSGIGIIPEKQNIIFEAFQQEDGSTRRKYGGTGLGLSISRELAKLLKGEIQLESTPGKGSIFTITIPINKSVADKIVAEEELLTKLIKGEVTESDLNKDEDAFKNQRLIAQRIPVAIEDDRDAIEINDRVILIVEDDTPFAKSLLNFTRQNGYKGIISVSGEEATKLAEQYQPHGILLDIQLPLKDGWEIMEELKGNPATKHIPVHMMSSHDAKYQSISKGAINFINKPVSIEKIQDIFKQIEVFNSHKPDKVLIIEDNIQHARALAYYLESLDVKVVISPTPENAKLQLKQNGINCIVLDLDSPSQQTYSILDELKGMVSFGLIPIIIFTGKNLSKTEELRLKQYSSSIVIKTAQSYQRVLDEVSLFLHLVAEKSEKTSKVQRKGKLKDVLQNKNVLIADDDVRNIFSLTKALEGVDMNVVSAVNGKEALDVLNERNDIDIVLMDMMMPEMDGYETTRRVRNNQTYKKVPIIAVTAKAMAGDREKCMNAGASDYISKPVDIDQLLSLLRVWLYDSIK